MKILKLCVQPQPKLTSYDIKWAVNRALLNMTPKKEEIGACIRRVLKYATLRDKFDDFIHDDLAALGIVKVEVHDEGLKFVRKEGKWRANYDYNSPNILWILFMDFCL